MMNILVINSGSSSIKYQLFDGRSLTPLASGLIEKIGQPAGRVRHGVMKHFDTKAITHTVEDIEIQNHERGLSFMIELLMDKEMGVLESPDEITAVGHRVVHGGEQFSQPTRINDAVKDTIAQLSPLAPLHNPANLTGIEVAQRLFPAAAQVAVFDTAFHQTMPPQAYRYAVPHELYEKHAVRVYGFHGTSHAYVAKRAIAYLDPNAVQTRLITLHLGNGCSITAVKDGRSVDTSMGFSPLAGLIMGTRSGDVDPALPAFLGNELGLSLTEIDHLLNKRSGLLGLTGQNDLRDIEKRFNQGDEEAALAMEMYAYRIRKYIGAYTAVLGTVDALVFTAGVGENSVLVRQLVCQGLEQSGIVLDTARNKQGRSGPVTEIQALESSTKILIIPTNEELEIAAQTKTLLEDNITP